MDKNFIVIVTYNAMLWIEQCLRSSKNYNIVVVDNCSSDNTVEHIRHNYPQVKIIEQKENLGFGKANNIGISFALELGAKYIFLLNQDAYLEPGTLEELIAVQKRNPEYGILSPLQLNGEGTRLDKNFSNYLTYQANPDFYSDYVLNKTLKEVYEVPFVNAAGWLLSKLCITKIGGFDPIFFHYGEDDNYCQRVIYHGLKVGVCPGTKLRHDRENRNRNEIQPESNEYLRNQARIFLTSYANINNSYNKELLKKAYQSKKSFIKNIIKLNFIRAFYFRKEEKIFRLAHKDIVQSRVINKKRGLHYLD